MALKWEEVKIEGFGRLSLRSVFRAKVPGGWLIMSDNRDGSGLTFLPDTDHKWDGNSLDEANTESAKRRF